MKIQVIRTTDGKFVGGVYDIDDVTIESVAKYGINATSIKWYGEYVHISNSNYTIIAKKIGE